MGPVVLPPVQGTLEYGNPLSLFIQFPDIPYGLPDLVHISQPQDGEWNPLPLILHGCQLLEHRIDRVIVIGSKKYRLFVEKGSDDGVEDGIGLPCAGRALDVGHRVLHGIVDGQ